MSDKITGPRGGVYARKGPRRYTETADFLKGLRRMVRRAGERVAGEDMDELRMLVMVRADLEDAISKAVNGCRELGGYSWQEIGDTLGTSKQAAQQRYGGKS